MPSITDYPWLSDLRAALDALPDDAARIDHIATALSWPRPYTDYPRAGDAAGWEASNWRDFAHRLGFTENRDSKHQFLYCHPAAGLFIGHSKTPGDFRSHMASMTQNRATARASGGRWLVAVRRWFERQDLPEGLTAEAFWSTELPAYIKALPTASEADTSSWPSMSSSDVLTARSVKATLHREFQLGVRAALSQAGFDATLAERAAMLLDADTDRLPGYLLDILRETLQFHRQQEAAERAAKARAREQRDQQIQREQAAKQKAADEASRREQLPQARFDKDLAQARQLIAGAVATLGRIQLPEYPGGELENRIVELGTELAAAREEINVCTSGLTALTAEKSALQDQLHARELALAELQGKVAAMERDNAAASDMLTDAAAAGPLREKLARLLAAVDAIDERAGFMDLARKLYDAKTTADSVR